MVLAQRISHVQLQYSHTIGRGEQFGPGFTYPIHMARGEDDLMYVLCRSSEYRPEGTRVTVCTVDEEYVNAFARGVPQQGPHEYNFEDGSLVWPVNVAIASNGNVYVSDEWLHRISMFTRDGEYIGKWDENVGSGDGQLDRPAGVAIDADDNVWVVDGNNHRVQKFTPDGQFLMKFGSYGSGDGELDSPWGIDIDNQGNIYIADWRNDRIQKFSSDGRFLMKFGSSGSGTASSTGRPTWLWTRTASSTWPTGSTTGYNTLTRRATSAAQRPAKPPFPSGARTSWTPTPRCGTSASARPTLNGSGTSGRPPASRWTSTTACSSAKARATASRCSRSRP